MQPKVKGRVALIVGAGDEIGAAIAQLLAAAGAEVVSVDVTDAKAIHACVSDVIARHGRIDILVNNGADLEGKAIAEMSAQDVDGAAVESFARSLHLLREVAPLMQKSNCGRIINISSMSYLGLPRQAATAAAKSALFGLTRSVALEMARNNVTLNCVVKGDIAKAGMDEETKGKIAGGIPVKRMGTPADVAYAVGFFASDNADYVTGQTFFVCGGKSNYFSMSV